MTIKPRSLAHLPGTSTEPIWTNPTYRATADEVARATADAQGSSRPMTSQPTDLGRALDPNDPDFATRSAAEELLADELTAREQAVAVLRAQRDALTEALAEAQLDVREATTAWNALHSEQGLTNEMLGAWLTSLTGEAPEIVDDPQDGDDKAVR